MEKQSPFVKEKNNQGKENHSDSLKSRFSLGLMTLTTLFSLTNLEAEKPEKKIFVVPHPFRQTTKPINPESQSTFVIPQKEQAFLSEEEKNPYSKINKLYHFYPRYWFLNSSERELIDKRIMKTASGGMILVSQRTCAEQDSSRMQQLQQEGEKTYLEHFPPLRGNHFMVIDRDKIYVWSVESPFEASCIMLQKDKPPIPIKYKGKELCSTRFKNARFSFDEQYGLVINDGIRITEIYDFFNADNYEFIFDDNRSIQIAGINPQQLEYPIAMGKPIQELKKNLYNFLVADPSFFDDPAKVMAFIKNEREENFHTAGIETIKKINGDPTVFFIPAQAGIGPRKFNYPEFIEALQLTMQKLEEVDPYIHDLLYKYGLRSIAGDPLDNFVSPVLVPNNATYQPESGTVYVNEKIRIKNNSFPRGFTSKPMDQRYALLRGLASTIYEESNAIYVKTQNIFNQESWIIGINKAKSFEYWIRTHEEGFKTQFILSDEGLKHFLKADIENVSRDYSQVIPSQNF